MTITGVQRPRLESLPADRAVSWGSEAIGLAAHAGLRLDDWQRYALTNMLWRKPDGKWSAFEYLLIVSRQNGKGSILEARELAGLYLFETDRLTIHTAHEHKTSSEHYLRVSSLIHETPDLSRKIIRESSAYGREFIELKAKPTIVIGAGGEYVRRAERHRLIFIARSGSSGRGFTADCLVYDEDMILDAGKVQASLPSLMARPNPQVIYTGSAGLKTSMQLAALRRRGVAGDSPSLAFMEWSIVPHDDYCQPGCREHDDPGDMASVAKANPALGIRITEEMIGRTAEAFRSDPVGYAREILGVGEYPAPLDAWLVIPQKWYHDTEVVDQPRLSHPVFAVDMTPDHDGAAIAVAGGRADDLTGVEITDCHSGTKWLLSRCIELHERWQPSTWVTDARVCAVLADDMEKAGLPVQRINATDVAAACGLLYDGFKDDWLRHLKSTYLRAALAAADRRPLGEAWAFDRRHTAVDISPLMASAFAVLGYRRSARAADYDIRESVHFDLAEIKRLCQLGVYGPGDLRRLRDEGLISATDLEALSDGGIF